MTAPTSSSDSMQTLAPLFPKGESDDLSSYAHRQFIGSLGLVLPLLLWVIGGLRPTEGLPRWEVLGSVSAYYYTGGVAAFVGVLVALGLFLYTYHGYKNQYRRRDRVAAIVAGSAAVLVATFPTAAPDRLAAPSWWTLRVGAIHYIAAVVLFLAFIYFSLFLFPKSKVGPGETLPPGKRFRNRIYIACGIAMAACILWAAIASLSGGPIFWPEVLALEFFAVSWLVKGRADRTVVAAGRRALYHGRHPHQLVGGLWRAIRE